MAVVHFQLVAGFRVRVSLAVEKSHADDVVESLRAHRAGVHAQTAPDVSRNSLHPLQPADAVRFSRIGDLLQLHACARAYLHVTHFDPVELAAARMNNHAPDAAITHEQVRSAADHKERLIFAPTKTN